MERVLDTELGSGLGSARQAFRDYGDRRSVVVAPDRGRFEARESYLYDIVKRAMKDLLNGTQRTASLAVLCRKCHKKIHKTAKEG